MTWDLTRMADEVISLFTPGCSVNLGIGLPTAVADRLPRDSAIMVHSENGVLGISGRPTRERASPTLINAGKETVAVGKGASFFDSALSFGMIRGGHIDFCVLGGMEVDVEGSLANWMIPGKKVTGIGGAMDLVNGAKQVVVMLRHFTRDGSPRLVPRCTLPLTGQGVVHKIVTDYGVFEPEGARFRIVRLAEGVEVPDLEIAAELLA